MRREDLTNIDARLTRTDWAPHQIAIQRAINPEAFNWKGQPTPPPRPLYVVRHPAGTTLDITTDWLEARRYAQQTGSKLYERRGTALRPWA